jgi:2-C-methyl-D-erythritol 2,4-cyclodiphosphate synthase
MRIGQGFDAHRLEPGCKLVLGGVTIPYARGLEGHSDGDVLFHAVADAILGAIGEGDLGRHFPSSDESLRGLDSRLIVERVVAMMRDKGFRLGNLDVTLIAQAPRLSPYQSEMAAGLEGALETSADRVNLKVTSTDTLGALGREEGIACLATVLLEGQNDT